MSEKNGEAAPQPTVEELTTEGEAIVALLRGAVARIEAWNDQVDALKEAHGWDPDVDESLPDEFAPLLKLQIVIPWATELDNIIYYDEEN